MSHRLPAEWEPQGAVLLTWPHADMDWADDLAAVEQCFQQIALSIASEQTVIISVPNRQVLTDLRQLAAAEQISASRIRGTVLPSNDIWVRDHGPISIELGNNKMQLLDFEFNGWGNKYPAELDNQISQGLKKQQLLGDSPLKTIDWVLEGGGIESNGAGSLLAHRGCFAARHPEMSTEDLEATLAKHLGVEHFLWLNEGALMGDDTDSHIDTLARFSATNSIVYQSCSEPADPHYAPLSAMRDELMRLRNPAGEAYELHALPLPQPQYAADGQRLPAGYANFLITNHAVLAPVFNDPADEAALAVLSQAFPEREIVPIDSRALIEQYGGIHCASMQLPASLKL